MNEFIPEIPDHQIQNAKKRIWSGMQNKLPERGFGAYQGILSSFRGANKEMLDSRLAKVQAKERLLDLLPNRVVEKEPVLAFSYARKSFAAVTLSAFFVFLVVPILQMPQIASAAITNVLEVAQGEVLVNGAPVDGEIFVQEGDRVYTGEGSMAHIQFADDSRVTLGPDSSMDILYVGVDLDNRANTNVILEQLDGRIWVQTLNLLDESYLSLHFPDGDVFVSQRASFDVRVDGDEVELQVARNLVDVRVDGDDLYEGTLGQGASLLANEDVVTEKMSDEVMEDIWWDFNLAYGKIHARSVEEKYKNEAIDRAIILPGNPLYVFKTFRETVVEVLAFSQEAKEEVASKHAENRLDEAQALIEQGDVEGATEVLEVYQDTVEDVLEDSDNEELLAHLDEVQKEMMSKQDLDEGEQLLSDSVTETTVAISSDPAEKNEIRMLSASQKLHMVGDLIEEGNYDGALANLSAYKEESISLLVSLEEVDLEDREAVVSDLLDQKLKDLQMLRVLSSELVIEDAVDASAQIYEEMSLMALSLREKALDSLSTFFTETEYDALLQQDVYERVKEGSEMGESLSDQFDAVEEELTAANSEPGVLMDVEQVEEVTDPRFDFTNETP
jgi:hypothetical protein